jgi:hypothetical protein
VRTLPQETILTRARRRRFKSVADKSKQIGKDFDSTFGMKIDERVVDSPSRKGAPEIQRPAKPPPPAARDEELDPPRGDSETDVEMEGHPVL